MYIIPQPRPKAPDGEGLVGFGAEPGHVQQGSGGFGAEPGHVQQGSGEGSGEGLGGFGAEPGQVQQGSREAHARFRKSALKFHPDKNKERTWV